MWTTPVYIIVILVSHSGITYGVSIQNFRNDSFLEEKIGIPLKMDQEALKSFGL